MAELFSVMAGRSQHTFTLGGIRFEAAPVTIREYGEYLALPADAKGNVFEDVHAEWLADKLKRRLSGTKTDPDTITAEWVMEELPLPTRNILMHVLIHGEMPGENTKATGNR